MSSTGKPDKQGECTTKGDNNTQACTCPAGYHGDVILDDAEKFYGCYINPTSYQDWFIEFKPDVDTQGNPLTTTTNAVVYDEITQQFTVKFEKSGGRKHKISLFKQDCNTEIAPNNLVGNATGQLDGVNPRDTKHEFLNVKINLDLSQMESSDLIDSATSEAKFCVRVALTDGDDVANPESWNFIEALVTTQIKIVGIIQEVSVKLQRAKVGGLRADGLTRVVHLDACQCDRPEDGFRSSDRCSDQWDGAHTSVGIKSPPRLTQKDTLNVCISTRLDDVEIVEIEMLTLTQEDPSSGLKMALPVIKDSTVQGQDSFEVTDNQRGHLQRVGIKLPSFFFSAVGSGANQLDIQVSGKAHVLPKQNGRRGRRLSNVVIHLRSPKRAKDTARSLQQEDEVEGTFSMPVQLRQEAFSRTSAFASATTFASTTSFMSTSSYQVDDKDEVQVSACTSPYVGITLFAAATLVQAL